MMPKIQCVIKRLLKMKKIGFNIDYGNICKDYNTVYLDRDNSDPATTACMRKVLSWVERLLSEMITTFDYKISRTNHEPTLKLSEIVSKRFLFYSLEKAVTVQSFILQTEDTYHDSLSQWAKNPNNILLIKNDEEGEGLFFYFNENSKVHQWLVNELGEMVDEVPFEEI
jgi:hypothetical protein